MEAEVLIDEVGDVRVPRFVPSVAPSNSKPFNAEELWTLEDNKHLRSVSSPSIPLGHVVVRIEALSSTGDTFFGLIGHIVNAGATPLALGSRVVTIACGALSNFAVVHEGSLGILDDGRPSTSTTAVAEASIACTFALGLGSVHNPSRLSSHHVVVCNDGSSMAQSIIWFCKTLAIRVSSISSQASATDFLALQIQPNDIVLAHSKTQLLGSFVPVSSRFFAWSSISHLLLSDPWAIGDAIQIGLAQTQDAVFNDCTSLRPEEYLPFVPESVHEQVLLGPNKAYILLGGIGSLIYI